MADPEKEEWNTEDIRKHRKDWSLFADFQLLGHLQQFSQNLMSETHSTLKQLDSLESQVASTSVEVSNVASRFSSLSDTQFVENRVYEDDITSPTSSSDTPPQEPVKRLDDKLQLERLTKALQDGIRVLDLKFEPVVLPRDDSDSDDNTSQSRLALKPRARCNDRRLPYLIGSREFLTDDTLGLLDPPSEDDTEEEDFTSCSDKSEHGSNEDEVDEPLVGGTREQKEYRKQHPTVIEEQVLVSGRAKHPVPQDLFDETADKKENEQLGVGVQQQSEERSIFPTYQPSDLWAPDSEQMKADKTTDKSQEFDVTGSGRLPVCIKDAESPGPSQSTKKTVPIGGVKVFGATQSPGAPNDRLKNEDFVSAVLVLPSTSTKKTGADLFESSDSGDDLFASTVSVLAPTNKSQRPKTNNDTSIYVAATSKVDQKKPSKSKSAPGFFNQRFKASTAEEVEKELEKDDLFSSSRPLPSPDTRSQFTTDDLFKSDASDIMTSSETAPGENVKTLFFNKKMLVSPSPTDTVGTSSQSRQAVNPKPTFTVVPKPIVPKPSFTVTNPGNVFDDDLDDLFSEEANKDKISAKLTVDRNNKSDYATADEPIAYMEIPKKGLEGRSIFDSDSEDDLFLTPHSQMSEPVLVGTGDENEPVNFKKEQKTLKTDFSSDIFGETKDLFYNLSTDIKTPDLFISPSVISAPKDIYGPSEDPLLHSSVRKEKSIVEAQNSDAVLSEQMNYDETSKEIMPSKKPEHPKSLDVTSVENLGSKKEKLPEKTNKPKVPKRVSTKSTTARDSPDGEKLTRTSPLKQVPGKLKASQLININPAALLPGARPQVKDAETPSSVEPELFGAVLPVGSHLSPHAAVPPEPSLPALAVPDVSPSQAAPAVTTELISGDVFPSSLASEPLSTHGAVLEEESEPSNTSLTPKHSSVSSQIVNAPVLHRGSHSEPVYPITSDLSTAAAGSTSHEEGMPPKNSLLLNINKERAKIQGKRRPSTRRARKEAIQASSIEAEPSIPPHSTFNLMSPSTDEEDLFGVPPLDTITDDKPLSPKTDIFGSPTVLSPVTTQEEPSLFESTSFAHSQPPPLEEEDELSIADNDIFGQNEHMFDDTVKDLKQIERKVISKVDDKETPGNLEEDSQFLYIRGAPPPLTASADEEDDELFSSTFITTTMPSNVDPLPVFLMDPKIYQPNSDPADLVSPLTKTETLPTNVDQLPGSLLDPKIYQSDSDFTDLVSSLRQTETLSSNVDQSPVSFPDSKIYQSDSDSVDILSSSKINTISTYRSDSDSPVVSSKTSSTYQSNFESADLSSKSILTCRSDSDSADISSLNETKTNPLYRSDSDSANLVSSLSQTTTTSLDVSQPVVCFPEITTYTSDTDSSSKPIHSADVVSDSTLVTGDQSIILGSTPEEPSVGGNQEDELFSFKSKTISSSWRRSSEPLFDESPVVPKKLIQGEPNEALVVSKVKSTESIACEPSSSSTIDKSLYYTAQSPLYLEQGIAKKEMPWKTDKSFDEDEEDSFNDLFSAVTEKKSKTSATKKSSLFGDEDDEDDIFVTPSTSKTSLTSLATAEESRKGVKPVTSKPVKLKSKEALSDPLQDFQE